VAGASGAAGLTDTDILIDAIRRQPDALTFISAQQQAHGVNISIVSAMELVRGCRNATELAHLQTFLGAVTTLPLSPQASRAAYSLMEAFSLSHGLQIPDALIAATALKRRLVLYTRNIRHFQMIPKLTVIPPY
jgi:predicted nucleic acid-binding protein